MLLFCKLNVLILANYISLTSIIGYAIYWWWFDIGCVHMHSTMTNGIRWVCVLFCVCRSSSVGKKIIIYCSWIKWRLLRWIRFSRTHTKISEFFKILWKFCLHSIAQSTRNVHGNISSIIHRNDISKQSMRKKIWYIHTKCRRDYDTINYIQLGFGRKLKATKGSCIYFALTESRII